VENQTNCNCSTRAGWRPDKALKRRTARPDDRRVRLGRRHVAALAATAVVGLGYVAVSQVRAAKSREPRAESRADARAEAQAQAAYAVKLKAFTTQANALLSGRVAVAEAVP